MGGPSTAIGLTSSLGDFWALLLFFFEAGSPSLAQAGLELAVLLQPPKYSASKYKPVLVTLDRFD